MYLSRLLIRPSTVEMRVFAACDTLIRCCCRLLCGGRRSLCGGGGSLCLTGLGICGSRCASGAGSIGDALLRTLVYGVNPLRVLSYLDCRPR